MTPLLVVGLGLAAIAAGALLLRTYGPRARVGRLLTVTPRVSIAAARDLAAAGRGRYVRVEGRLDADDEFPDEGDRPLVFRRARLNARVDGRWRTLTEERRSVPFRVREGLDVIAIDADALDAGVVVIARVFEGAAGEVPGRLPVQLPADTPVRLVVETLSSIDQATVMGVPAAAPDGEPRMGTGGGRPLVVSSLADPEAMRVLAGGDRRRPVLAAAALFTGLVLMSAGFGWALLSGRL